MNPIKTKETNFYYLGPSDAISDMPCHKDEDMTYSVWELSPLERELIARGANVRLGVMGHPTPPVILHIVPNADEFAKVVVKCYKCGKLPDDPIHGLDPDLPNCHAFKVPIGDRFMPHELN